MSTQWLDGFDDLNTDRYENVANMSTFVNGGWFEYGYALKSAAAGALTSFRTPLLESDDMFVVGMAIRASSPADHAFLRFMDVGGNTLLTLEMTGDATTITFNVRLGPITGQIIGTFSIAASLINRQYFEFKVIAADDPDGYWEARINGSTIAYGEDVQTTSGATAIRKVIFGLQDDGAAGEIVIDDLYIINSLGSLNNDFLGDVVIETINPNTDGDLLEWIPSSGLDLSNMIDDGIPDDDTTYISGDPVTSFLCIYDQLSLIQGELGPIMIESRCALNIAGSQTYKHHVKNSDGSFNDSATLTVDSTTYTEFRTVLEENPFTNRPATKEELESWQIGARAL